MDEDIHICGSCKGQFTNLDEFILHKRQCKARMEQVTKAMSGNLSTTVPDQETMPENPPSQGMSSTPCLRFTIRNFYM